MLSTSISGNNVVTPIFLISEDEVVGNCKLWIIGNDFVASAFRIHFKKNTNTFFLKDNFQVDVFWR